MMSARSSPRRRARARPIATDPHSPADRRFHVEPDANQTRSRATRLEHWAARASGPIGRARYFVGFGAGVEPSLPPTGTITHPYFGL